MSRRKSREIVMKLLYQVQFDNEEIETQIINLIEEENVSEKEREYIIDIVNGTISKEKEIDEIIQKYSKKRVISRIPKINLAILRSSIYEIENRQDIPVNVTINEAIELAKKYSTDDSAPFVNALLGNVVREEKNE